MFAGQRRRARHDGRLRDGADEQAERRDYDKLAALQQPMFESRLDARKRIDAVLTAQQHEELRRGWPGPR